MFNIKNNIKKKTISHCNQAYKLDTFKRQLSAEEELKITRNKQTLLYNIRTKTKKTRSHPCACQPLLLISADFPPWDPRAAK